MPMIETCDTIFMLPSFCSVVECGHTQLFETMKRDVAGSLGNVVNATRLSRQIPARHRPRPRLVTEQNNRIEIQEGQDFVNEDGSVKPFRASDLTRQSGSFRSVTVPNFCRRFRLRLFGYMLRFVVSAAAANMMLVRCNSDVPIS